MSTRITLHCDKTFQYGSCTAFLATDARTIEEAQDAGSEHGWRIGRTKQDGDHCPACSGYAHVRSVSNVVHLHPERSQEP